MYSEIPPRSPPPVPQLLFLRPRSSLQLPFTLFLSTSATTKPPSNLSFYNFSSLRTSTYPPYNENSPFLFCSRSPQPPRCPRQLSLFVPRQHLPRQKDSLRRVRNDSFHS
ncbi:hypothetical protein DFH06DRAFT_1479969 [Mycena polygramma]|nr:hypothetical protein DFH06DRAFT_1479969 [Mycena polygramma]